MAKLLKITSYLIATDDCDEKDIESTIPDILSSKFNCIKLPSNVESISVVDEYSDDWNTNPLNFICCTIDTCESYFNS